MNTCLAGRTAAVVPAGRVGTQRNFYWRGVCVLLMLAVFSPGLASAGAFSVMPLRVELSKSESTRVINLQNLDDKPVTVQLQVMAWSHKDGVDRFTPTRDIIVTPQIFYLKPNSLQIIRAGLVRKPDSQDELAYRLFVEEIPEPPPTDFKGAQIALKISLPVFVMPDKNVTQALEFQAAHEADGKLKVKITNTGRGHAHIQQLSVFAARTAHQSLAKHDKPVYVLPGQERSLVLKTDVRDMPHPDKFFITATTRRGPVESHVDLDTP